MTEIGVHLFRCIRCDAAFIVRWRDEKYGGVTKFRALEVDACRVCGKGSVEYVGIVYVTEDSEHED